MFTKQGDLRETITLAATGRRMSVSEFEAIDDWDRFYRYELINELLIVSPFPSFVERLLNEDLAGRLYASAEARSIELQSVYEEPIYTSRAIRRVDRAIWIGLDRPWRAKIDVPTILIDLIPKGRRSTYRDYLDRRDEYLAIGVQEYWIIDRFDRTMTVFTGTPELPVETVVREQDIYLTPLLPEFELPLGQLLKVADTYSQ